MIARIRKGNDFRHIWPITWDGQPEDFSDATDITLTATVYGQVKTLVEGVDYHIDGGTVMVDFTPAICDITGTYTVELNYIKPSAEFTDGDRRSAVDVQAFQIVNTSAEANATEGVSLPSEAMAAYALKYDDLTEAQKDELRGKGITSIDLTGEVGDTKTYTITYADGLTFDFSVTDGHTPIFTFDGTTLLIDGVPQVDLKGETGNGIASVELTSTAGLVKTYTITFTDATTTTFTVTDGSTPEITFQGTTIYVDGVAGPDLKGEAGRGITSVELLSTVGLAKTYRITFTDATTYDYVVTDGAAGTGATVVQTTGGSLVDVMSQKAVTDELGQLAGEMNQNSNLETTSKNIVGAINEVNRIVSIHHADNKAVRRWNNTLSTPIGEAVGVLDFLRELPRILGLGCYLVADDLTKKKLHRDNHNFYEDGSPALLDGSEGQYMFCWNAFYFTTWDEGDYTYEAVSLQPIVGKKSYYIPAGGYSAIGHGVIDRTDLTLCSVVNSDPRYRGGAGAVLTGTLAGENDPQTTMLGMPATVYGIHTAQDYARKRGENWNACWFVSRAAIEILIRIVYGNRHTQDTVMEKDSNGLYQGGFGYGLAGMPDWPGYNGTYPLVPTSAGVEYGDLCGSFEYTIPKADGSAYHTTGIPSFFGLKNFFGHLWFGVAGLTINATETVTEAYVMPSMFGGWNYASLTGMLKAAELPRSNGYIKRLSMNLLCALPTEVGASTSTDFADYFYENTAGGSYGLRARWGGGGANSGAYAGAFCTSSNYTATTAFAYRSVPLCFFEEDPIVEL